MKDYLIFMYKPLVLGIFFAFVIFSVNDANAAMESAEMSKNVLETKEKNRPSCPSGGEFLMADVVAIDHPMVFNRLGAQNVNWMMYALRHDVAYFNNSDASQTKWHVFEYLPKGEGEKSEFENIKNLAKKQRVSEEEFKEIEKEFKGQGSDAEKVRNPDNFRASSLNISLRPDLRPRPLVLRVAAGDCLEVRFTNLLEWVVRKDDPAKSVEENAEEKKRGPGNPNDAKLIDFPKDHPTAKAVVKDALYPHKSDDQVFSRLVGFHPQGLELLGGIDSDSSNVGRNLDIHEEGEPDRFPNAGSLAEPGETRTYYFYAPHEGAFLVSNPGAVFGGEGTSGNSGVGLFGAVAVQPKGARFYRSQITEEEFRMVMRETFNLKRPALEYEAVYPGKQVSVSHCPQNDVWCKEGKAGRPILNMVHKRRIIHSDINAMIIGPNWNGSFPQDTYPLEKLGKQNPSLPNRLEPFREFVSVFHDENAATQAFPYFFSHPELGHTLHGVRDAFMINYGSGGIGAEIIANRLKAGPMQDCLDCAYEEFFLSSFVVGDSAMLVDRPTNLDVGQCQPEYIPATEEDKKKFELNIWKYQEEFNSYCVQKEKAAQAYYPHDPSNVSHSYIGDKVKFRNVHSGKEQHIFHLHNHQWLFNPNDDNSNYIDAQGLGPGSGYTYEIAFGGSGNRNKTVGDAIFHCHFYPHFAQGMWYMWRNHDVLETGTYLDVTENGLSTKEEPKGGESTKEESEAGLPLFERKKFHSVPFGLANGKPASNARALPDGEIIAGTPIPAIVPLPGKAVPLQPGKVIVKPKEVDGVELGSIAKVQDLKDNPGYPFWIAGVSEFKDNKKNILVKASIGSRPTTPPMDMDTTAEGFDGGLPRHALAGYRAGGEDKSELGRLTAEKHLLKAKPVYFPEEGTAIEKIAMDFHAKREHDTYQFNMTRFVENDVFLANGAEPTPGAPYNDPCIDDQGTLLTTDKTKNFKFYGGEPGSYFSSKDDIAEIEFSGESPRIYKGANLQLDVVFNKIGYHYPQQRILTLWEDVPDLMDMKKPPEPLVLRMNTYDCAVYQHTNLIPKEYYLDDYQITTPTDVIGQHIHLPKWDLTSADGGANGWNYEDGTFSPGAVRERIHAINVWNNDEGNEPVPQLDDESTVLLVPKAHPYFGTLTGFQETEEKCLEYWDSANSIEDFERSWGIPRKCDWLGARTTIQRWFSDPIVNSGLVHRGLGTTFTHDHLGPSTHQQLGLYATMLTEPPGSIWKHNETGELLYDKARRDDGGPTSWQAMIVGKGKGEDAGTLDIDEDKRDDSHREFFLQFGDFQHAYEKDVFVGVDEDGAPINENYTKEHEEELRFVKKDKKLPMKDSFRYAIHPSNRKPADELVDIFKYPPTCAGGEEEKRLPGAVYNSENPPLRPCAESISADDVGMMVVNYRNEPIAARVYDPETKKQTEGVAGDLAFALQTRTDRAKNELNMKFGETPYAPLTGEILKGDPFTPIMRTYSGDLVKVKIQGGSHEHEHNGSINGMTWLQGGSGFGQAPHSGWRNAQNTGLSEQFTFTSSIWERQSTYFHTDRLYTVDSSQDGLWNGVWGVLRNLSHLHNGHEENDPLATLPNNPIPIILKTGSEPKDHHNVCPAGAPHKPYHVVAILARDALKAEGGTLVYNPRTTPITIKNENDDIIGTFKGPLHDPTAIVYVMESDLDEEMKLKAGVPLEPLVLRAAAGDCIIVHLHNYLPEEEGDMPDLHGYTSLTGMIIRDREKEALTHEEDTPKPPPSVTTFNNNLLRPSNHIGLHPQMVTYDVHYGDGNNVGINKASTVPPGGTTEYHWYAGKYEVISPRANCPNELVLDQAANMSSEKNEEYREFRKQLRNFAINLNGRLSSDILTEESFKARAMRILRIYLEPKNQKNISEAKGIIQDIINGLKEKKVFESPKTLAEEQALDQKFSDDSKVYNRNDESLKVIRNLSDEKEDMIKDCESVLTKANVTRLASKKFDNYHLAKKIINIIFESPYEAVDPEGTDPYAWRKELASDWRETAYSSENAKIVELTGESEGNNCSSTVRHVGIEFGGSTLTPPDRIKQGQKGAVGALVIEPEKATWTGEDDLDWVVDRQVYDPKQDKKRRTRTTATVTYKSKNENGEIEQRSFNEMVLVHQKGLNLRWNNKVFLKPSEGCPKEANEETRDGRQFCVEENPPVQSLAAEKEDAHEESDKTAPEDAHDAGQMAINYGTEPMWFRFGLAPDSSFGNDGFGGVLHAYQAFSNKCCDNGGTATTAQKDLGEPYVPIATVPAGSELRLRALLPTGIGRATSFSLHGHNWARDPYLAEHTEGGMPKGNKPSEWGVGSKCIGHNPMQFAMGGQESLTPMAHFDVVIPSAGGTAAIDGDYLWQDHGGFGITSGLWSIVRVLPMAESDKTQFNPKPLRSNCELP